MSGVSINGRPWPVPPWPEEWAKKLNAGHCLSKEELDKLRVEAELSVNLEITDPNYARASRKWRAQFHEDCVIEETRQKLQEKQRATEKMVRRQAEKTQRKRELRERKLQRGMIKREAVLSEQEKHRTETLERLALNERRTLVRETIQQALAANQRKDGHVERVMFTHPSMLGDTPGAGTYDPAPLPTRATNFATHPTTEVRKRETSAPGPGSHDPKRQDYFSKDPEHNRVGKRPGITFGLLTKAGEPGIYGPGPAAYTYEPERKPGGAISKHKVKSDLDRAMEAARETPGPGDYYTEVALSTGKASSITGRTALPEEVYLEQQKRAPGPGSYETQPHRIRGGVMGDTAYKGFLPSLNPGPGSYHQTPTVKQEQELRKLSKQVR